MNLDLTRLSLNQMTVRHLSVPEAAELCVRHGIGWIGLWRDPVARTGLGASAKIVRDAGLRVSGLCRGGFFNAPNAREDNRRAVEEAAELGTDLLVLVCGGMAGKSHEESRTTDSPGAAKSAEVRLSSGAAPGGLCALDEARRVVADGIAELAPWAAEHGVRLGIEPLHPMYAASRSVINTLGQALAMAMATGATNVGVVIDVYHVWWDPELWEQVTRASNRIFGLHICDWLDPLPDFVNGRGLMGDGVADIRRLREAVDTVGYAGPIEVEIFNEALWAMPPDRIIELVKERWRERV